MFPIPASSSVRELLDYRVMGPSQAKQILEKVTVETMQESGLVTKNFKAGLPYISSDDRARSVGKILKQLDNYLRKTTPALPIYLSKPMVGPNGIIPGGPPIFVPQDIRPVRVHLRLFRIPRTYQGLLDNNLRFLPPDSYIPNVSVDKKIAVITRYCKFLTFKLRKLLGVDNIDSYGFITRITPEFITNPFIAVPDEGSIFYGISFSLNPRELGRVPGFFALVKDIKSIVRVFQTLTRVRLSEGLENVGTFSRTNNG